MEYVLVFKFINTAFAPSKDQPAGLKAVKECTLGCSEAMSSGIYSLSGSTKANRLSTAS